MTYKLLIIFPCFFHLVLFNLLMNVNDIIKEIT